MKTRHIPFAAVAALLIALFCAAPLLADDDDHKLTVITDEGEEIVCVFGGDDVIRMMSSDSGDEIFELDLGDIEIAIGEAFDELEDAFDDLDLNLHIDGDEKYMRFAADDSEVILDFDALIEGVSTACSALGDMNFVESHHRFRGAEGMEELENELDALREEMRELKKELRRERDRARH